MEDKVLDNLHDKIVDIQQRLKVPKSERNEFANFDYRTLSSIEDKVKPLLKEHNLVMWFEDEMVEIGGRVYVKATVTVTDGTDDKFKTSAYAREAVAPKAKTDDAQLTGGTSTYARKYAVAGLFLIDDSKDDPDHTSGKVEPRKAPVTVSSPRKANASDELLKKKKEIMEKYKESGNTEPIKDFLMKTIGVATVDIIEDANTVLEALNDK